MPLPRLSQCTCWILPHAGSTKCHKSDGALRLDFVRGFHGSHVNHYMLATAPSFAVGEYWDSLSYSNGLPDFNQVCRLNNAHASVLPLPARCLGTLAMQRFLLPVLKCARFMHVTANLQSLWNCLVLRLLVKGRMLQDAHRQRIIDWINAAGGTATAFDVTTKGILHAVFQVLPWLL